MKTNLFQDLSLVRMIDPNSDPVGAWVQTSAPWCSVGFGPFIVIGTSDVDVAEQFARTQPVFNAFNPPIK